MNLLEYAKKIEPCQRNWDVSYIIPDEHIDYITEVCTTVPTKQNLNCYSLVCIQDRKTIEKIFESSYDPKVSYQTFRRNGQVLANLLLIWTPGPQPAETESDLDIAVGISSGAAALAAAELGYSTGFCKCFETKPITKILKKDVGVKTKNPILMLGIGLPNINFNLRDVVVDGKKIGTKHSKGKKDIKIFKH